MCRRLFALACVAVLVGTQFGCHWSSRCDERHGWFSARKRVEPPCQLAGRNEGCFDANTGQPCPCPPEAGGVPGGVMPGGTLPYPYMPGPAVPGPAPFPNELHMPSPSDRIQPPAVPIPAPGDAGLPFPTSPGTPLKTGLNK
jgi:hypothetical protein